MIAYPTSYDLMMYALSIICSRKINISLYQAQIFLSLFIFKKYH